MKQILSLTNDSYQIDRRILNEADSLVKRGDRVTLWPLCSTVALPAELQDGVAIFSPGSGQSAPSLATRMTNFAKRVAVHGAAIKAMLQSVQTMLFDPARRPAALAESAGVPSFDVVYAHDLPALPLALALRDRQAQGKVILDAHELFDEQFDLLVSKTARRYWREVADEFVPRCDGVMTVTERIAGELKQRHGLPETPTVLRNACPFVPEIRPTGELRRLYGIAEARRIVLCQGGLLAGRSLEDLIDAAPCLAGRNVVIVFLGFGQPSYVRRLERRAERLGVEGTVFLGKAVEPDRILDYTRDADLGFVSNRGEGINNTDGAPNRLFEYIQARVPVLSFEHNGVRQVLSRSETGWVVRWESAEELARLIEEKLDEAVGFPKDTLDAAAREFSWEAEEPKLFALVDRVLKGD